MEQTMMKRRRRGQRTRGAILLAAEKIFARGGLAGARTDAIAAAAGVNKAMLFYHFASKEKLYQAVIEEHFRDFNRQAMEILSASGPASDLLLRYVELHFDFIAAHHRYAALYQQIMSGGGKALQQLVRKYFKPRARAVERLLLRGMNEGEFRRANPHHAAVSIAAMIVFYFSAAPVLRLMGYPDAYAAPKLRRRKREVLDFIRWGLFLNSPMRNVRSKSA